MESPLVSIIIISYNQSKYIKEILDSVKNQTYSNIELIVADDASADNSVAVFKNWLKENNYPAKSNYHQNNTGAVTILNECIELTRGKYIKFIAADDFLHPDYINNCITEFKATQADIIYTKAYGIDDNSQVISEDIFGSPEYTNEQELKALLYKGNFISGAAMMSKKSVYDKIGKYKKEVLLEDYDLVLNALNQNLNIKYLSQPLMYYRRHEGNITRTKFDLLQAHTVMTKIKYDINSEFSGIINSDVLKQLKLMNPHLGLIKNIYSNYRKKNMFYLLLIDKPLLIKVFIKLRLL